ncbi:translation machinery-associated protein 16 [Halyomorpha halys]|uniref:translation machinery-associated protein 16 n=1 Tax=Halyomorpha halys TaxID=286706 RepID=UPI0006D4D296|nr:translation machinery-associated protein 16 [Halyomorpha halys]
MGKNKFPKKAENRALTISHPNSRKAKALTKQIIKTSTRQKTKMQYAIKRNLFGEKLIWFHDNIEPVEEYTAAMLDELFQKYLSRFDDELEQISIKHSIGQRKNRQHASREDVIKMTIKRDVEEYNTCGIEMVDILNNKQLKMFKEWDGEMGFLNQFNIRRFSKSFLANYKPPHGKGTNKNSKSTSECHDEEMPVVEGDQECEPDEKPEEISEFVVGASDIHPTAEVEMDGT